MAEMLTVQEVARRLDLPPLEVGRRIRKGDIKASKFGWVWAVEAKEVEQVRGAEWYKRYQRRRAA